MVFVPGDPFFPTDEYNAVILEAAGIAVKCQAVAVRFSQLPLIDASGMAEWCLIRELTVDGFSTGEIMVRLTATKGGDASTRYAPISFSKLVDAATGRPRLKIIGQPAETETAAYRIARYFLDSSVKQLQARTYVTTAVPDTLPWLNKTVQMQDGFKGVMYATPGLSGGISDPIRLELRLLNLTSSLMD